LIGGTVMTDESELKITGDLFAEEIEEAKG
jgi:hypothetical protein